MGSIIKQISIKIKSFYTSCVNFLKKDIVFYILLIILSSSLSFFLGELSEFQNQKKKKLSEIQLIHGKERDKIYFVASKKGKYYYLPWCYHGSEKNKIIFKTKKEAEKNKYKPSKSCEGM